MRTLRSLIRMYPEKLLQNHLPKASQFYLALEGTTPVGCCALEVYSKRLAEIRSLAVHPEYQGKGIASALVAACLKEARKKKVYEVLSITSAIAFFEKQGFNTFHNEKFALIKVLG